VTIISNENCAQILNLFLLDLTSDILLQSNVTIISNENCAQILKHNGTDDLISYASLRLALSKGINDQIMCTVGLHNELTNVFTVNVFPTE
jgi:hypothetical protein